MSFVYLCNTVSCVSGATACIIVLGSKNMTLHALCGLPDAIIVAFESIERSSTAWPV